MAAERHEGTKGNNENDSDEGNNLQRQQRDVKLIAHELQRGVCEREIQEPFPQDPRGEPVPIHGMGLDNLPPVMAEPMQIINSVSIIRR